VSEYRNEFVQALRNGKTMRSCMFNMLEQRHAADFANGQAGVKYYNDLFDAVEAAEVPEALEEFQSRFFPLLDPDGTRSRPAPPPSEDAPTTARRGKRWLVAACSAAVLLAGAIIALNAIPDAPKPRRALAAAPAVTEIVTEPKQIAELPAATTDSQAVAAEPIKVPEPQATAPDPVTVQSTSSRDETR
jgi:hypothetical protein